MKDRNCRCCLAHYQKPTDYWCEVPMHNEDGSIVEPVGFCEFCDKYNKTWYIKDYKCHKVVV